MPFFVYVRFYLILAGAAGHCCPWTYRWRPIEISIKLVFVWRRSMSDSMDHTDATAMSHTAKDILHDHTDATAMSHPAKDILHAAYRYY
jgi:hypothetical protein